MGEPSPGPWTVHKDGDNWPLIMAGGPSGRIVANVNPESCPDQSSVPAFVVMPAEANARMIAAAPDLLAAVNSALSEYEVYGKISSDMVAVMRAASAKAKGEC